MKVIVSGINPKLDDKDYLKLLKVLLELEIDFEVDFGIEF